VLLACLGGLCFWYGTLAPAPAANDYPGNAAVLGEYQEYVGDRVVVGGRVVETSPLTIELTDGAADPRRVTVLDHDSSAAVGDRLRVYGVLREDGTVEAIRTLAVPRWGLQYTWGISLVAGLWVLGRILSHWEVDRTRLGLRPRGNTTGTERE